MVVVLSEEVLVVVLVDWFCWEGRGGRAASVGVEGGGSRGMAGVRVGGGAE